MPARLQHHPERVARLALEAFVWTGEGSPTLAERRKRLPELLSDPDREKAQRVMAAMLEMGKIDVAELEQAAVSA